jgi:hypothetical protein
VAMKEYFLSVKIGIYVGQEVIPYVVQIHSHER